MSWFSVCHLITEMKDTRGAQTKAERMHADERTCVCVSFGAPCSCGIRTHPNKMPFSNEMELNCKVLGKTLMEQRSVVRHTNKTVFQMCLQVLPAAAGKHDDIVNDRASENKKLKPKMHQSGAMA